MCVVRWEDRFISFSNPFLQTGHTNSSFVFCCGGGCVGGFGKKCGRSFVFCCVGGCVGGFKKKCVGCMRLCVSCDCAIKVSAAFAAEGESPIAYAASCAATSLILAATSCR